MSDLKRLLGVDFPLIQAPMAGVQDSALTIAVATSGGLGSLPCAMLDEPSLRRELATIQAQTRQPINVNFFCHRLPEVDAAREAQWRESLAPYYRELAIEVARIRSGTTRTPFTAHALEVLREFRPAVVSFHFGLPSPELMAGLRSWNATILSSATTVEEARWLEGHGAHAIIAQGLEAGGHRGHFLSSDLTAQLSTLALVPQIVRKVAIPVIAAGAIADRAGIAAAFRLGAAAVQVGTAFLLCPEARTGPAHRAALKSDASRHTALTNVFSGGAARGIVNRLMRERGPINPLAPAFPLASSAVAPLRAAAEARGSGDFSPLWAGQNVTGCRETPAAELVRELLS
ncbi:MAG TPA: nitronate monooxygenase [Steroidobacteraceae bacterium]|jgi:nitronate monooxygenase